MEIVARAAGYVKLVVGIGNNAAWMAVLEAHDHAKKCKRYKQQVKQSFKAALDAFHNYERHLVSEYGVRFFHVADMDERTRKKYGNITDRQYYEFWTATGAQAYTDTRNIITMLVNKYRKSLQRHNVADAEHVAWVMMAEAALELALKMHDVAMKKAHEATNVSIDLLHRNFGVLRLTAVARQWRASLALLSPESEAYDLDPSEERDIALGLEQLEESWGDVNLMFDSTIKTTEDYTEDVFRTKGESKKAQRQLAEMRDKILTDKDE